MPVSIPGARDSRHAQMRRQSPAAVLVPHPCCPVAEPLETEVEDATAASWEVGHTHTHTHTLENNTLTIIDIGRSPRIVFQDKEQLTAKAPRFFIVCSTCHARGMRTRKQPSRNLDPKQAVLPQKSQNSAFHVVNRKAETTMWVLGKFFHNLVCTSLSACPPVLGFQTPP